MDKRILIVDDSRTSLQTLRSMLRAEPYELLTAGDGVDGVELARQIRPDLILMDFVMPRLDGLGAVRELKQNPATRNIPVIMVTTKENPDAVERSYAAGCSDYVTKPVDKGELLSKISWHLDT